MLVEAPCSGQNTRNSEGAPAPKATLLQIAPESKRTRGGPQVGLGEACGEAGRGLQRSSNPVWGQCPVMPSVRTELR
jgi:hypothetical protein